MATDLNENILQESNYLISDSKLSAYLLNPSFYFWTIVSLHVLIWTLLPTLLRTTLPIDALEGFVWGSQLQLGYDRNPWLNAWLTRLAIDLGGNSGYLIYFLSQLCILTAFWSVWRLGKKIISAWHALIAVLILEAIQYYTLASVDFNDNVLEIGLWPLLALFFYQAVKQQRLRDWLAVGIIAGLAMMAKYYTTIFLLSLFLFLIIEPTARSSFKQKNMYYGLIVFVLIIFPHGYWLFQNNFSTIHYAQERVRENTIQGILHYLLPASRFALMQVLNFLGACLLFMFIFLGKKKSSVNLGKNCAVSDFDKRFLWVVGTGTYIITVVLALSIGWQLHLLWGMPLLSLWGLILLAYTQPKISFPQLSRFLVAFFLVFLTFPLVYSISLLRMDNHSSGNFPAQEISKSVTQLWQQYYPEPLQFVAGDRYIAGYVALYANPHPVVYIAADANQSPWIDESELRRSGGVFIQSVVDGENFPADILKRFPMLQVLGVQYYNRPRSGNQPNPVGVLIGILPPQKAVPSSLMVNLNATQLKS